MSWFCFCCGVRASRAVCWADAPVYPNLLSAHFSTDPRAAGWTVEPVSAPAHGADWINGEVRTRGPRWQSPKFAVEPSAYYKMNVRIKGQPRSMWAAVFFDADGHQLTSDHYSGLDMSKKWTRQDFFFRARHNAKTCQLWFHTLEPAENDLCLSDVEVRKANLEELAEWADRIFAKLPPPEFIVPAQRGTFLPRTMAAIRSGRPIRVVMLGDSIVNDTSNSAWDVLLKRVYPNARIEIVTSVRGGTGCQYYRQENRVEQYVIQFKPDLLIIGGISNGFDVEAIRDVIRQVRARISPEVLVLTDPLGVGGDPRAWPQMLVAPGKQGDDFRKAFAMIGPYRTGLRAMAAEEKVEFFDVGTIWNTYIANSGKPYEFYLRDPVHANERGRQILAQMLVGFLAQDGVPIRPGSK